MKKKELLALGLSVAMTTTTMTGCASQDEVNSLNAQVSELQAQVTELQSEVDTEQAKSDNVEKQNESLTAQIEELQSEIESLNEELENDEVVIESADSTISEMSINVTKYAEAGSTIYSKAEESEENKIADLEMNTEVFVVATFSDANNDNTWSAIATLVNVDESEKEMYQMISTIEKGTEKSKNKKIDFMLRSANSITVAGKTIKSDDLAENQEIRIVYARTSLLSNSKVTEQQKTSAEKGSTPKQTQQQGSSTDGRIPDADYSWWDNTPSTTPGCPSMTGNAIMFN